MACNTSTLADRSKQRAVCFASQVQCKASLSRSKLTRNEFASSWYSRNEQKQVIQNCRTLVERRQSGKKPKRNSSYRGLETFHEREYQEVRQQIDSCVYAVILEQYRQEVEGIYDIDSLAKVSLQHSNDCSGMARIRAKIDEFEAKRIFKTLETDADNEIQSIASVYSTEPSSSSIQSLDELEMDEGNESQSISSVEGRGQFSSSIQSLGELEDESQSMSSVDSMEPSSSSMQSLEEFDNAVYTTCIARRLASLNEPRIALLVRET